MKRFKQLQLVSSDILLLTVFYVSNKMLTGVVFTFQSFLRFNRFYVSIVFTSQLFLRLNRFYISNKVLKPQSWFMQRRLGGNLIGNSSPLKLDLESFKSVNFKNCSISLIAEFHKSFIVFNRIQNHLYD